MKQTKIKQVQGQASLKSFFKPKNQAAQDAIQTEDKEIAICQQNQELNIKVEDDQINQQLNDINFNTVLNPSLEQNGALDQENSQDILKKREEYIKKKLSPFKYSKKKSFKSKVKSKIKQDDVSQSPLNKKRNKQSKYLRMTPSSKKKIKIEEDDVIDKEQKLASIYKQERLSQIQFSPIEDKSKQNQMEVQEEVAAMVSQFDSRQDAFSNNSRKSESSKGSKSDGKAIRQLQINDFRQFNSTLKNNQNKLDLKNISKTNIQNDSRMIVEYEKNDRIMECETNVIINHTTEEKIKQTFNKNINQNLINDMIEEIEQNCLNKNDIILNNNLIEENKENNLDRNTQYLINTAVEDIKETCFQIDNQINQIQEAQLPKVNQKKKMKNLLSFCVPTQGKTSEKTKQKENILKIDQENALQSESRPNQNKDDQSKDQHIPLNNVLQKQSENRIKSVKGSTNSKLIFGQSNLNKIENVSQKQLDHDKPQDSDQCLQVEHIQNQNQQEQANEQIEIEENQKNIDAQTKANEKNAQNMFKLFITHIQQNIKDLNEIQLKNFNKLQKFKPVTKNSYENQIKECELSEQYDEFIFQYEKIQEIKNQFSDYIEFMKIPKKKKNEINKQINQVYKQFPSNKEEFEKSIKQNLDIYYSRFQKFTSFPDNNQNNKLKKDEKQEVQKMEMKGKDSYRVITYTTQWDQQVEIRPTEEQLDVIVSDIKKDTKIIACAGSGKTTTLVIRLKYLLDHGVKPNQIIISTFNIEAGKFISQKVYEMIGKEVQQSILIGNIDKIAYKFIRSELEAKQKTSQSVLLFSQREYCDIWLAHIKKYKFQYLQYKYFFFDEFQDVSELQYEILMEFKKLNCVLTVIGDDAQNIYGFRDTKIDIIQNRINDDLKKKKKDLQEFKLTANYRSTHLITKFANKIIEKNENLIKKTMQSAQEVHGETEEEKMKNKYDKEGEYPYLHIFDSEKQQNESIIRRVLSLVKHKGFQFKDIAIIGPMNDQLKKFEEVVEKHNQKSIQSDQIPYQAFITLKFEDFKLVEFNAAPQKQNKLTISTIHRSKGLEWDIVYFLGCNDDQFPMAFVQKNKNQACTILEEQRRLFYVGATRAIKELNFCCVVKEPEKMNEKDKAQGKYKVTRFFADIPRDYYRADIILDFQDHIIKDYKWIEFDESQNAEDDQICIKIREVISKMNSKQLEDINIYTQNIVQDKVVKSLYMEKHEISQQVKDNQLFSEMGMFFDRCIVRMIGEKYDAKNSFYNQVAAQVILPQIYELHLPENLFRLFLRYSKFFTTFDSFQLDDQRNVIDRFKNEGDREKSEQDIQDMKELHNILSYNAEIQCLKKIQIFNFQKHKPNRYFQDQFERLGQSYIIALSEYMNKHKKSEEIFENIYKISKCGFLFENRRKYLYNNNLVAILDYELLKSIQLNFINGYLSQYQNIECKKIYKTKNIQGLIDLIANQNHLIFFKFDIFETYKKEDFLNYLFAASYMHVVDKITIEQISIFNFLSGTIQSIDLTGWDQQELYFNQIEQIAQGQILQNAQNNILQIIEQEEDLVLNKEQKDDLRKLIFSSKTPQELKENIENIKSGQKSINKAQMIAEDNEDEQEIQYHCNNVHNENQYDRSMLVEENIQPIEEQKDQSQLIDQNFIQHNKQIINSSDPLRKKIQFEEKNNPVIKFQDTQIYEQNCQLNNNNNFDQIINNKLTNDFCQFINKQNDQQLLYEKDEQDQVNLRESYNIQNNKVLQDTSNEVQKDKKQPQPIKEMNKNNQHQNQFQHQQIQDKKKQFYQNSNLNKQINQQSFEQNNYENSIQEESQQVDQNWVFKKFQLTQYEEDDICNIQSQEEDNDFIYKLNDKKQTKANKIISSNPNKQNAFKDSNKSPNNKLNINQNTKVKPVKITPINNKHYTQPVKLLQQNNKEIPNLYEEDDIESDLDSQDAIMIQKFVFNPEQQKKKN
ncbi:hypothetical protein ABPG74_009162 [Tetrahymena malaccensis]